MSLKLRPSTSEERKLLFQETLLNSTDKVTKVSPFSVLDAISEGVAKISGKSEKDIILSLSQLFPDIASGTQLDQVAKNFGISPRFGASGSSTYVLVVGVPGTTYFSSIHLLQSRSGIQFSFEDPSFTIPQEGYIYVSVKSNTIGSNTNVPPLNINKLVTSPQGHNYIVNEVAASGGRDIEDDILFRQRIKDGVNIYARGTLSMIEQKFMSINNKVLRCYYEGISITGKSIISILTQNGQSLTTAELDELLIGASDIFPLTELVTPSSNLPNVELRNIKYQPIDVSFIVDYDTNYSIDDIKRDIQIRMMKYIDLRTFNPVKQKVEWDELLQIVKSTKGVKYVPDQDFFPRQDIVIDTHSFPRLRGFRVLDLKGTILVDLQGTLSSIYYSNLPDFKYQQYL